MNNENSRTLTKKKTAFWGMAAVVSAIILFSTIEVVSKNIAGKCHIDAYMMVFLRFFGTGLILLSLGLPGYLQRGGTLGWRDWKNFILNGLIGITISLTLFHAAISMFENASSSAVVFSANAVFAIVIARFMNHEPWAAHKWAALILALGGIALFIFEKGTPSMGAVKALLVMSLAALGFAYSVCLTRKVVNHYGATFFMGISSLLGSLFILPMAVLNLQGNLADEMLKAWPELLYIVLIGTALAYLLYYLGLKRVSAFIASMVFFLKPGLACILAWVVRGEKMNAWTFSGTLIILMALCLTLMNNRK